MKKSVMWISMLVGGLGFIAFVLGIAAEATHSKAHEVRNTEDDSCIYPRSPAFTLGVSAALLLMMAQIIINVAAGCFCCESRGTYQSTLKTPIAITCLVLSWITFAVAFGILLVGAALNDHHDQNESFFSTYCYVVKSGVFAGGAVLSLVTVALGITYYIILSAIKSSPPWIYQNQDVAMTQPRPSSDQPVFVPENLYTYYNNPHYDGSEKPNPAIHRK